jgi:hypothetical protein
VRKETEKKESDGDEPAAMTFLTRTDVNYGTVVLVAT